MIIAAEVRVALGLAASITDGDRALIEFLTPLAMGAVKSSLKYDPIYRAGRVEFYPRMERLGTLQNAGVWDSNGTRAFYDGLGRSRFLQLAHIPVREVTEVRVDFDGMFGQRAGSFGDDTVWVAGEDYFQELIAVGFNATGQIITRTGWPVEPGTVKVTYSSGYTVDELSGRASSGIDAGPIKQAALLAVIKAFKTLKAQQKTAAGFPAGPLTSESLGDYSYSIDGASAAKLTAMMAALPPEAEALLQPFRHYGLMVL